MELEEIDRHLTSLRRTQGIITETLTELERQREDQLGHQGHDASADYRLPGIPPVPVHQQDGSLRIEPLPEAGMTLEEADAFLLQVLRDAPDGSPQQHDARARRLRLRQDLGEPAATPQAVPPRGLSILPRR